MGSTVGEWRLSPLVVLVVGLTTILVFVAFGLFHLLVVGRESRLCLQTAAWRWASWGDLWLTRGPALAVLRVVQNRWRRAVDWTVSRVPDRPRLP